MAGSIPTAYTTGFNNGYPILFVVRILLSEGDNLTVASQPGVSFSYGGIGISPDYEYVRGSDSGAYLAAEIDGSEVQGIGEIDSQMNVQDGGGVGAVGECNIVFLNQARFDDFISQFDIENRQVEIWEGYNPPGHSVAIDTDMLLKFRGVIRDASSWDYTRFTIPCVDRRSLDNILLPNHKIQKDVFPNAPDPVIGKVLPILVGDFASFNTDTTLPYQAGKFDSPPTLLVDDKNLYYLAADHPVTFTPDNHFIIDKPDDWIAKITAGRTVELPDTLLQNGGTILQVIGSGLSDVFVIPKNPATGNTVADISGAVDSDDVTYLQMVAGDSAVFGFGNLVSPGTVVKQDEADAIVTDVAAYVVGIDYLDCFGNVAVQVVDRRNDAAQDIGNLDPLLSAVGLVVNVPGMTWDDLMNQTVKIICVGSQHVKIYRVHVWIRARAGSAQWQQVTIRRASVDLLGSYFRPAITSSIYVVQNVRSNVFPSATGVKYGNWIEGRSSGHATGEVIQQPAYFIEYLLRERLELSSGEIDSSSFDNVGLTGTGTRQAHTIAASMLEESEAFEHIRQICNEFCLQLVVTNTGKYRLVSLDVVPAGTSTVFTATSNHIMYEGVPQISISKTPISKIKNVFTLNYRMNYASGQMERSVYFRADGSNNIGVTIGLFGDAPRSTWGSWLGESQSRYNQTVEYVADLHYVRDDTTAGLILMNLASWLAFKRLVVEMKLKRNLQTVALEIGDHIRVTNDLLGNIATGVVNFIITKINYPGVSKTMAPYITISCEELPNQYTGLTQIKKLSDVILGEQ